MVNFRAHNVGFLCFSGALGRLLSSLLLSLFAFLLTFLFGFLGATLGSLLLLAARIDGSLGSAGKCLRYRHTMALVCFTNADIFD